MYDEEIYRPQNLDEVWEQMLSDARRAYAEVLESDEDYFVGIMDGCLSSLAILALYMGRMGEFAMLCKEFNDTLWETPQ